MNIIKILKYFLPSLPGYFYCLVVPLVTTTYLLVTRYRDNFFSNNEVDYFVIQNNFFSRLFLENSWIAYLDRAIDFIFWGVLAAVVLLIAWAVSAVRITLANHNTIESFQNFKTPKASWHGRLAVTIGLRTVLVVLITYVVIAILIKIIPSLSLAVDQLINSYSHQHLISLIKANLYLWVAQIFIIFFIKVFRSTGVE